MIKMPQLKQIREQMMEELTQIPQFRALKAMERFMAEISEIYDAPPLFSDQEKPEYQERAPHAQEGRVARDSMGATPQKITPYIPAHRVA